MKRTTIRRGGAAAAVLALSLTLAACGGDQEGGTTGGDTAGGSDDPAAQTFGPACDQVPTDGDGSFAGMVNDPVATAAGNNPLLGTLVTAVGAAGLGDTLNGSGDLTVFAPYDPAFEELGDAVGDLVAGAEADPANSDLAKILTHHVLGENDDPESVTGDKETLNGDSLTIEGDTESGMTVSDGTVTANVLCGNIATANATVYVIDKVLAGADLG